MENSLKDGAIEVNSVCKEALHTAAIPVSRWTRKIASLLGLVKLGRDAIFLWDADPRG